MTNLHNTVLYTGVTSDLKARINQHKTKKYPESFTSKFNICKLVYFECFNSMSAAIAREKQVKGGSRKRKVDLIDCFNPEWVDMFESLL